MTVTKLKNGKWLVDISDGYSHLTGNRIRHRKKGFRTRKEAERYEADYRINQLHQFKPKDRLSVNYVEIKEEPLTHKNPIILNTLLNFSLMLI